MDTSRQLLIDQHATSRTPLGSIPGINKSYAHTSVCCFVGNKLRQLKPGGVGYGLGKTMIPQHSFAIKFFHSDDAIFIYQVPAEFVSKVLAPVNYPFMNMRYSLPPVSSFHCALFGLGQFPLRFSKGLFGV